VEHKKDFPCSATEQGKIFYWLKKRRGKNALAFLKIIVFNFFLFKEKVAKR